MEKENKNYAFIDGQNLYMGTTKLYKKLGAPCFASLDNKDTRKKIEMKKAP